MTLKMKSPFCHAAAALLAALLIVLGGGSLVARAASVTVTDYDSLVAAIEAAGSDPTTIVIGADIEIADSITIPEGADITLTDDGTARTVSSTVPMFVVEGGTLTLQGTSDDNLVFAGNGTKSSYGSVLTVNAGTATLAAGTVKGGKIASDRSGAVSVHGSSEFNMSGGVITETRTESGSFVIGTVYLDDHTTFNLNGGSITNNSGFRCGAGINTIPYGESQVTINMSGGSIDNNSALYYGGGVFVYGNSVLNLSGGSISDNKVTGNPGGGGGVLLAVGGSMVMTGGEVSRNAVSGGSGGGICVLDDASLTVTGGTISDNTSSSCGGGIHVDDATGSLTLANTLVTENTASSMGGGMWLCPDGHAIIKATEGIALYGNTVPGTDTLTAGDDFVNVYTGRQEGSTELSERMLGGGLNRYYADGSVYGSDDESADKTAWRYGRVSDDSTRYDASDPGDLQSVGNIQVNAAYHNEPSAGAKASARNHATVTITGNSSMRGGGIACNGSLSVLTDKTDDWSLEVTKSWQNVSKAKQHPVTIWLFINEIALDPVTLSADNNWKATFTGLPEISTVAGSFYAVEGELDESGNFIEETRYDVLRDLDVDYDSQQITVAITNALRPTEPDNEPEPEPEPEGQTCELSFTKKWADDADKAGKRPSTEEFAKLVTLYADGEAVTDAEVDVEDNEDGTYYVVWEDLPKLADDGREIAYTARESAVSGYTADKTEVTDGGTITNTYEKEKTPKPEPKPKPELKKTPKKAEPRAATLPKTEDIAAPLGVLLGMGATLAGFGLLRRRTGA